MLRPARTADITSPGIWRNAAGTGGQPSAALFCHLDYLGGATYICLARLYGSDMVDDAATARRYRNRAKEVRAIAESVTERKSRMTLLRIAADYERMARLRVRVGKADRVIAGTALEGSRA